MSEKQQGKIRIVITESTPGASKELRALLSEHSGNPSGDRSMEIVAVAHDGLEAAQMAAQLNPQVIVLDEEMPGMNGYEAVELISLAAPDVASVLLVEPERASSTEVVRSALRAGARAVVGPEVDSEQFIELLTQLAQIEASRQRPEYDLITDPAKMPVTISVTGAKGGIGKSMTSVNLAVCFARRHPGEVVLIDFYGQYGNCSLMLDLQPDHSIADLAGFADELDSNMVESHLTTHQESGLKVLAGVSGSAGVGGRLDEHEEISFLAELIGLLRRSYRFLFFDIPPLIGRASSYVYSRSQFIVLVSALIDLSSVQDTKTLYEQLVDERIAAERIKLVVSRYARSNELTVQDLEAATGGTVVHRIPEDGASAASSINEGIPAVLSRPNSALGRGITELADLLEEAMAQERRIRERQMK